MKRGYIYSCIINITRAAFAHGVIPDVRTNRHNFRIISPSKIIIFTLVIINATNINVNQLFDIQLELLFD